MRVRDSLSPRRIASRFNKEQNAGPKVLNTRFTWLRFTTTLAVSVGLEVFRQELVRFAGSGAVTAVPEVTFDPQLVQLFL